MTPQTYIFIGRAGSGKGTQAELLMKAIKEKDPNSSFFTLETGAKFREIIKKDNYSGKLMSAIYMAGGVQPSFLSTMLWANHMVDTLKEEQHIVIDGSPRGVYEAYTLDSAMKFYSRKSPFIIYLDIKDEHAMDRLLKRARMDDVVPAIKTRLAWFETDVMKAIEFYRDNKNYRFLDIDGTKKIEEVHADIMSKVF